MGNQRLSFLDSSELVRRALIAALESELERLESRLRGLVLQEFAASQLRIHGHWVVAALALVALEDGDERSFERFVSTFLHLTRLAPERLNALCRIIRRARRLRQIADAGVYGYLREATRREEQRIRQDREKGERLWGRLGQVPIPLDPDMPTPEAEDPLVVLIRKEERQVKLGVIDDLRNSGLPADQAEFLRLLEQDLPPAEALKAIGAGWPTLQALQRKAQRRLRRLA